MAGKAHNNKTDIDLWGKICRDYYEKGSAEFVIKRDDGYEESMSPGMYFRSILSPVEELVMSKVRGKVLDIGCGPGANVLWLQNHGYKVTGIDISPGAIDIARRRGCKSVEVISLWEISDLPDMYDTVIMIGNNAGLPGSIERMGEFLEILKEKTSDGALLIAHSLDPVKTTNEQHLAYHQRNVKGGRYKGQIRIRMEYQGYVSPWWDIVFFEENVLINLCNQHGWQHIDTIPAGNSFFLMARKI